MGGQALSVAHAPLARMLRSQTMGTCFLEGYGECGGGITGEHYISKNILKKMAVGQSVSIGGLPFQPDSTLENLGIKGLEANVLCGTHNHGLSDLDSEAGRLFDTLNAIDKSPTVVARLTQFDGEQIQLWLLKVVCGLLAGPKVKGGPVQDKWKKIITRGDWPEGWGLYVARGTGPQIFVGELYIETLTRSDNGLLAGANFYLAGVQFVLRLGKPDHPSAVGVYRPRSLIFKLPEGERRVEVRWQDPSRNDAVLYEKVGTTKDGPEHREGWTESTDPKKQRHPKKT